MLSELCYKIKMTQLLDIHILSDSQWMRAADCVADAKIVVVYVIHLAVSGLTVRLPVWPWQQVCVKRVRKWGVRATWIFIMTSPVYWLQRGGHTQVRLFGPPESTVNWPGRRREEGGSEHIAYIRVIQVLPVADNWIDEDDVIRHLANTGKPPNSLRNVEMGTGCRGYHSLRWCLHTTTIWPCHFSVTSSEWKIHFSLIDINLYWCIYVTLYNKSMNLN